MTTEGALAFLREHQPLPPDSDLSQEVIAMYAAVMTHFVQHPDPRCIPLFLGSFGDGTGCELYKRVDEVLWAHPKDLVVADLVSALQSPHESVRVWCLLLAMEYLDKSLIPSLLSVLQTAGVRERRLCALALQAAPDLCDKRLIEDLMAREGDLETKSRLEMVWRQCRGTDA